MNRKYLVAAALSLAAMAATPAQAGDGTAGLPPSVRHVLLISVDGLHALDLANYTARHPESTLAELSRSGITYTNNVTSSPSDSFPGLASLVTGGSPITAGFWYDDTYNRALSPPAQTDGLGNPGGACPGKIGTNVAWDEAIDTDLTRLDGGGGINPKYLVRDPRNNCRTIMPHEYLRVNTIFEVVKERRWPHRPGRTSIPLTSGPKVPAVKGSMTSTARRSIRIPGRAAAVPGLRTSAIRRLRLPTTAGPTSFATCALLRFAPRPSGAQPDRRLYARSQRQGRRPCSVWNELPGGQRRREAGGRPGER